MILHWCRDNLEVRLKLGLGVQLELRAAKSF